MLGMKIKYFAFLKHLCNDINKPMLVSVIIPYFNDEININKSVFSALNQTYKKIEIIIVDDELLLNLLKY